MRPTQHSHQEAYLFSNDKTVMDHRKALAILTEVFEILNKLLQTTERTYKIPSNVPFLILGSTQVPYVTQLSVA